MERCWRLSLLFYRLFLKDYESIMARLTWNGFVPSPPTIPSKHCQPCRASHFASPFTRSSENLVKHHVKGNAFSDDHLTLCYRLT